MTFFWKRISYTNMMEINNLYPENIMLILFSCPIFIYS